MPALLIKDLAPALHRKLKQAAARNRRSMTRQALVLLEEGLHGAERATELPPPLKGRFPITKRLIDQAKRAGRL